ncbi:MAG: B12-binding domain-containing radical SAM protein [Promethearchaeota archaeon]
MIFLKKKKLLKDWRKGINPKPDVNSTRTPSENLKNKRILFLEPRGVKANVFSFAMRYPLLGPLRMTTILRQQGYNAIMYNENLAKKDISRKILKAADILILTLLTQTAKRGYEIARKYKELRPDGKVIFGGIHVSFNVEEALPYCDQLVKGEGGYIILDIVENKFKEKVIETNRIKDLGNLPIPDLKAVYNHKRIKIAPILTSLGCPWNCSFCCVTSMFGHEYRRFPIEQIIETIKKYKAKRVFFLDDNFCADKKRILELFERIKEENLKFNWIAQVRADLARDEEFVKEMALANCARVFIGFESVNQKSLDSVVKNATIDTYINAVKVFHKYGIPIHAMFIFGLDHDDKTIFDETVEFCKKNGIESAQFLAITPFPGTRFYDELDKSRLITFDTDLYDGNHIIIDPMKMTRSELYKGIIRAYERFYSFGALFKGLIRDIKNFSKEKIRSRAFRIKKAYNNFWRSVGFKIIILKLKWRNRKYLSELVNYSGPHYCESYI